MNRHRPRFALAVGAVLALATVAAACGDDDDSVSASTAAVTTVGGATSSAPAAGSGDTGGTIKLGFSAWPGWFPWQVAEEKGLFEANGVDVDLTYFESYTDSLNALATGQLDGNTQTLNDTISSLAGGADQVIVLVNDNSTGNDQIIANADIASIADLKGKSVGVEEGTVDHFLLLLGLAEEGLGPDDIDLQPLATDAAAAAFAAGRLDAVVFAPFTTKALERDGAKALFTSKDFPGAIPDHLVLSRDVVESRPEAVQALVDTWFDTLTWIEANHDEAIDIMAKRAGVTPEEYADYDAGTTIFSLDENRAAFTSGDDMSHLGFAADSIATFLVDNGLIDKAPDLTTLFEPKFVESVSAS